MTPRNPYRAAGTFVGDAYVEREADRRLQKELLDNQRYPFFCAPRQNGKSSLIANTMQRLPSAQFRTVLIDLSPFDVSDYMAFMGDFLESIARQLGFPAAAIQPKYPEDTFTTWLTGIEQSLVVFVDEVDKLYQAPFRESFLSKIRSLFNKRAEPSYQVLNRLQFVLSGAVHPTRLIPNEYQSPFNIGIEIRLSELRPDEVAALARPLCSANDGLDATAIGEAIYYFTSGHVYLSQLILERMWDGLQKNLSAHTQKNIDVIAHEIVVQARQNIHFTNIFNLITKDKDLHEHFLQHVARKELTEEALQDLVIAGISDRARPIRNEIYRRVFGPQGPLELISAIPQPTRASLRMLLMEAFADSQSLEAFCHDHFPLVYPNALRLDNRNDIISLLFKQVDRDTLVSAFTHSYPEKFAQLRSLLTYHDGLGKEQSRITGVHAAAAPQVESLPAAEPVLNPTLLSGLPAAPPAVSVRSLLAARDAGGKLSADSQLAEDSAMSYASPVEPPSVLDFNLAPSAPASPRTLVKRTGRFATTGNPVVADFTSLLKARDQVRQEQAVAASAELTAREQELTAKIRQRREEMRQTPTLQPEEFIGERYRLARVIGLGGIGTVWVAHDYLTERLVAIKVLHPHLASEPGTLERFIRGARQMASLVHPNIVRVLEGPAEDHGFHYFVMDHIDDDDLMEVVRRQKLSREQMLRIILQIGEALQFAHERGIVHRDVKPGNILLNLEGQAFLTDFDLVVAANTSSITGPGPLGSMLYASPEMMDDARRADARTDQYGLAMTTVFVLQDGNLHTAMLYERHRLVDSLPVADATRAVLRRATALAPTERWGSVREFCTELAAGWNQPPSKQLGEHTDVTMMNFRRATSVGWMLAGALGFGALLTGIAASTLGIHPFDGTHPSHLDASVGNGPTQDLAATASENMSTAWKHRDLSAGPDFVGIEPRSGKTGMAIIPAGTFVMGTGVSDRDGQQDERPAHEERIAGYYLDQTEVTVASYAECVASGACKKTSPGFSCNLEQSARAQDPINCVDWLQAKSYCTWKGKRLPTEAEWEYAARGPASAAGREGSGPPELCWARSTEQGTCTVASHREGPWGLFDLAGNVWEWTESPYRECYAASCPTRPASRVIRGGSWFDTQPRSLRPQSRGWQPAGTQSPFVGFRCARDSGERLFAPKVFSSPGATLSNEVIRRVMVQAEAKFTHCGQESHGAVLSIQVGVAASGAVAEARIAGPLGESNTGRCIVQQVKALKFPSFTDNTTKHFVWSYSIPSAPR